MSKVKVWIQDLEWVRTKVSLEGEGLSFGEIYMNGGTLDLSGLTLKFDQIKANSNNVLSQALNRGKFKFRKQAKLSLSWQYLQ